MKIFKIPWNNGLTTKIWNRPTDKLEDKIIVYNGVTYLCLFDNVQECSYEVILRNEYLFCKYTYFIYCLSKYISMISWGYGKDFTWIKKIFGKPSNISQQDILVYYGKLFSNEVSKPEYPFDYVKSVFTEGVINGTLPKVESEMQYRYIKLLKDYNEDPIFKLKAGTIGRCVGDRVEFLDEYGMPLSDKKSGTICMYDIDLENPDSGMLFQDLGTEYKFNKNIREK